MVKPPAFNQKILGRGGAKYASPRYRRKKKGQRFRGPKTVLRISNKTIQTLGVETLPYPGTRLANGGTPGGETAPISEDQPK